MGVMRSPWQNSVTIFAQRLMPYPILLAVEGGFTIFDDSAQLRVFFFSGHFNVFDCWSFQCRREIRTWTFTILSFHARA